ncbi:trihelix transcription factor ASIL1-like [Salvia hispanica]|uniref:trihelix transcription factor ASIL1-like n=1 Tax=Salvia hispanica TaxID=49212 RepID=UPI0020092E0D|nr:trihelix transcription factor ASIL1-like [Salvia hispanica]
MADDSHTRTPSASRRLPPPCWSPDETVALIEAYRDKWYSLRRGNLKATHWQEVADDVAARCPAGLPKTPVQCRHKMEKLRKRYRSEIQRAAAHRFNSSWAHFQSMCSMEKGPNPAPSSSDDDYNNNSIRRVNDLYNSNQKGAYGGQLNENNGAGSGFRIKIPGRATQGPTVAKVYSKFDEMGGSNPIYHNPRFTNYAAGVNGAASTKISRDGFVGAGQIRKRADEMPKKRDGLSELVAAIHGLGEGFMRMEKAKMDMVKQIEEMRMEMELKRTEMLLDSEQRIVEAFAQAKSERSAKRAKRNSTTPD